MAGVALSATTRIVRDTHLAIARRAFRASGPGGRLAHLAHDTVSRGVYACVDGGVRAAGHAAALVAASRSEHPAYRPVPDTARGAVVVGALNGAWGDRLASSRSPWSLRMTVRHAGGDVALTPTALAATHPDATGDVAVWLHGLCETDAAWRLGARDHWGDPASTHGSRLRADAGLTPVYLRYNSGLHICDNGADLDRLLDDLVAAWPVPLRRLTLIGHSMGGLVIRAACHAALERDAGWLPYAERIVYLGSPHLGAPLEVAASAATVALRRLPETRTLAAALASRSAGIKDLRYGDVRASDWAGVADPDAWRAEPAECGELLATATHYYVGATIGQRPDSMIARVIGDALVPWSSASGTGRRRRLALEVDRGRHLGGLHHFDLLNHPRVYAVLREWLAP